LKYVALICARGGSKGLPHKNILPLNGLPLISWSIKLVQKMENISRVIVSTDSSKIAQIAKEDGAEVPFIRPEYLAKDDSPEWLVWRHALNFLKSENYEVDGLIIVPPTSPLRNQEDINNCINEFEKGSIDSVITVTEAQRSPYFNMVKIDSKGYSSLVIPPQSKKIIRRQDAPIIFDMTTVAYIVRPQFVFEKDGLFDGRVRSVFIPNKRSVDIDTLFDFKMAEFLINNE